MSTSLNRGRSFRLGQYPTNSKARETEERVVTNEVDARIRESLRGLRFGSVNVIVQDGVVVQIDKIEKTRMRDDRNTK